VSPHLHHQIAPVGFRRIGLRRPDKMGPKRRRDRGPQKVLLTLVACLLLLSSTATAQVKEVRRVLIFTEGNLSSPAVAAVDQEIRAGLEKSPYVIERYSEYTETVLFPREASDRKLREWYRNRKPDVIIAAGPSPIKFMAESHEKLFAETPIVICGSSEEQADNPKLDSDFTGVWMTIDPAKTLQAGLQLRPSTQHVVVVGGVSPYDRHVETIVRKQLRGYESKIEIEYLTDLPMPALLEHLRHLSDNTLVLYTSLTQDAAGTDFIPALESAPMVASAANAPVFVMADTLVGRGTLGGYLVSFAAQGKVAAGIAMRILQGERPRDIPIVRGANVYVFDWRVLQRWGLKESALPLESIVLFREPSVWQAYGRYILGVTLLLLAQTLLILGLLWQRARRRKVETSLAERLAFESLLSDLSTTFINLPEEQVDLNIEQSLGQIASFLHLDRITLFEFSGEGTELRPTSSWHSEGSERVPVDLKPIPWPWWTSRALHRGPVTFPDPHLSTDEASNVRRYLLGSGIQSIASIPLGIGGEIIGAISFVSTTRRMLWTIEVVRQLKVLAEIFSNALKRKRATHALLTSQAVLRESEERLRMAIDAAKLGGFEWDLQSGDNPWFGEKYALLGMTPADRSGSAQDLWDRVHPEDFDELRKAVEIAKQNRAGFEQEYRVVWRDGTVRWLRSVGRFLYAPDGAPQRMLGISMDVTERKLAEQALRQREAELTEAQSLAQVGSWRWEVKTDTVSWSRELYRIAGMDPSMPAVSYKDHSKLYTAESWERLRAVVEEALRTGTPYELDLEMIRADGARRWLVARGEAHRDASGAVVQLRGTVHDITERKRTEEALRESEERLRLAQEAAHVGIFEWDIQKNKHHWSPEMERIYGLSPGSFDSTSEAWIERIHTDDREHLQRQIHSHFQEGGTLDSHFRIVRPSGEIRWLFSRGTLFWDATGKPSRVLGFCIDVTDRKRAEESVRESEERLHLAIQAGGMYAYEWDPLTDRVIRSAECVDILGKDEPLHTTRREVASRVHPDDLEQFAANRSVPTPEHPNSQMTYRVLRDDGSLVWLEKRARAFFDDQGKMQKMIGVIADITARKRAEEALRESEKRFELVANTAPVLIWMSGPDKLCTYFNEPWLEFTGRPIERELGNGWAEGVHPEDFATCFDTYVKAFDRRETFRMEYRLRHHDGEYRWILDIGVPRFNPDGSFAGYIGSCMDVTDRKLAEEALSGVSRKLIEAHEEERRHIARELHDDINQRLALLEIELEELGVSPPDSFREVSNRANALRKHLSDISIDIQTISHRLHSSKLEYLGIVAAIKSFCKELSDKQKVEINFTYDLVPPALPQDVSLSLFRVLQEALRNAVRHSGVRQFDVALRGSSQEIELTVHDAGVGFDLIATMTKPGLGLISMQERIRLVKGTISIVSNPGSGTTIEARVPLGLSRGAQQALGQHM
jgi:PAS domain S-box-containing protein